MKKVIVPVTLLLASNFAFAAPVYLECVTTNDDGVESLYSIKLDESTGKITHTHGNGSAFNADGFFSANEIAYKRVSNSSGSLTIDTYGIDRTTLKYSRKLTMEPSDPTFLKDLPRKTIIDVVGSCELAKITNRKI
ncbi:MAG: hypothetical protein ACTJH9_13780 [Pseudoalteromonas sp.]|uniref:hypothetical protein n=1 Tax=Pseudoalteromonas TaxID=53246 RepID=UPI003F991974